LRFAAASLSKNMNFFSQTIKKTVITTLRRIQGKQQISIKKSSLSTKQQLVKQKLKLNLRKKKI